MKNKSKGKSILIAILIVIGVFFIIGLFFGGDDSANVNEGNSIQAQIDGEVDLAPVPKDMSVEVIKSSFATNYEGKPAIIITYSFSNLNGEPKSFWATFEPHVYQDGIELSKAYDLYDDANEMKDIKVGKTLEVEHAYLLNDESTSVDVEIATFWGTDPFYTTSINITE